MKRWVFSLRRKIERVSAVLTATGSSFHHRGARTENSLDRAELPPGAWSGVAFRRPEEAERSIPRERDLVYQQRPRIPRERDLVDQQRSSIPTQT